MIYSRTQFIKSLLLSTGGVLLGTNLYSKEKPSFVIEDNKKPLKPELVKMFVGKAHSDMDTVKQMLEENPTLLNSAWDWQGGDFETALGAASHVGHKKLASYLIDKGAQANIFTACLFGKIEIVKPMIKAFPQLINAVGPHGYSLLHHAEKGGKEALIVKDFLKDKGLKKSRFELKLSK